MPETLNPDDVESDAQRDARRSQLRWDALTSFHRAPCLRPSLAIGALGGLGIGMLRYVGGAGSRAAFTWGSTVGGLLSMTSWYTCRRAMYAQMHEESDLITRLQAGDKDALHAYQNLLEERQARQKVAGQHASDCDECAKRS